MSTQFSPDPRASLISNRTVAQSILSEWKDDRLEPEDKRTRRFGYNPALQLQMDPIHSGLQMRSIEAGRLILFETSPISRQNKSVDKDDRDPPAVMMELLAGEGLGAVFHQNHAMGFRELLPLRGKSDDEALDLFYLVHPPLFECVDHGIIPKCIYELDVCVTCRMAVLKTMQGLPQEAAPLLAVLRESVSVAYSYIASEWRKYTAEVAGTKAGTNRNIALGALTDDHLFFMQQLHGRTPDDMELAKIAANAEAQARVMETHMDRQSAQIADAIREGRGDNSEIVALRQQMERMEKFITELQNKPSE